MAFGGVLWILVLLCLFLVLSGVCLKEAYVINAFDGWCVVLHSLK